MNLKERLFLTALIITIMASLFGIKYLNRYNTRINMFLHVQESIESDWEREYGDKPNISYESNPMGVTITYESKNGDNKDEYELKNPAYYIFYYLIVINLIICLRFVYKKIHIWFRAYLSNRVK